MTLHNVRVNSIYSQSFIQIGPLVSEILRCTPKMNPILLDRYHTITEYTFLLLFHLVLKLILLELEEDVGQVHTKQLDKYQLIAIQQID